MSLGRLGAARREPPLRDINMTPLIDVMLVLLVIFMLAAPFMVGAVRVALPAAAGSSVATQRPVLALGLRADGQLERAQQPLDDASARVWMERAVAAQPDTELLLSADARVPHGRVVEVMALAQKAGVRQLGFVTQAPATVARAPAR